MQRSRLSSMPAERLPFMGSLLLAVATSWASVGIAVNVWAYIAAHYRHRVLIHTLIIEWREWTHKVWAAVLPFGKLEPEVKDFITLVTLTVVTAAAVHRLDLRQSRPKLHVGVEWIGLVAFSLFGAVLAKPLFEGLYASGALREAGPIIGGTWINSWVVFCVLWPSAMLYRAHHAEKVNEGSFVTLSLGSVLAAAFIASGIIILIGTPLAELPIVATLFVSVVVYFLMLWYLASRDAYVLFFQAFVVLLFALFLDFMIYSVFVRWPLTIEK